MTRSLFSRDVFAELDRLQRQFSGTFEPSPSIRGIGRGKDAIFARENAIGLLSSSHPLVGQMTGLRLPEGESENEHQASRQTHPADRNSMTMRLVCHMAQTSPAAPKEGRQHQSMGKPNGAPPQPDEACGGG